MPEAADLSDLKRERREQWLELIHTLNPDVDPSSVRLMDEVRKTAHSLRIIGTNSLAAAGLSYAKYRLLMSLMVSEEFDGRAELNPSEISERQGTSRNTISALIRDLEDDGLIERRLDQQDRRKFNIRLTNAGREKVRGHAGEHFMAIADCFRVLDKEEMEVLSSLMAKLRHKACAKSREYYLGKPGGNDANNR
jgi:DNA-binding MarR family transcriptional regulator